MTQVRAGTRAPDPAQTAGWRESLAESWPLLVTGLICVAFAGIFAIELPHRTVDRLSPSLLFAAVGITGVVGGLASFLTGPDDPEPVSQSLRTAPGPIRASTEDPASLFTEAPDRWNGRPVPEVVVGRLTPTPSPKRRGASTYSDPSGDEGPRRGLPASRAEPRWTKGRLLRLSEEGELTVYSVDDALRDLEYVTRTIHARRAGSPPISGSPDP